MQHLAGVKHTQKTLGRYGTFATITEFRINLHPFCVSFITLITLTRIDLNFASMKKQLFSMFAFLLLQTPRAAPAERFQAVLALLMCTFRREAGLLQLQSAR